MIVVIGRTLSGMAAAARLARLGHEVSLIGENSTRTLLNHFELPAAWRDLFKKSGQPMTGALNSFRLSLALAPPVTYLLPDGTSLSLPDDRAGQFYAISSVFGQGQAQLWRNLLDELDAVWKTLRNHGLETPSRPQSRTVKRRLWLERTLSDVADRAGKMAPVILAEGFFSGTDSPQAPGLLALRQNMVRTFGRYRLTTHQGHTAAADSLVRLLEKRLADRGVSCEDGPGPRLDTTPRSVGFLWRRSRAALCPLISSADSGTAAEIIDLTGSRPIRTIRAECGSQLIDYRLMRPEPSAGLAPDNSRSWLLRPLPSAHYASSSCLAGGEPWAELMSAALAVYQLHEKLTGEDCRPTNRSFKMPRLKKTN